MTRNAGVRSLVRARLFGSTSRVLDIPRLVERFTSQPGATTAARPFEHGALNRAIVIKHALRPHERSAFDHDRWIATKLIFPFTTADLGQGGMSLFVGERGFLEKIMKFLDLSAPDESFTRDERLVRILDSIPSFDPFLIAERAALDEVQLPAGLIDLSDNDLVSLRQSIAKSLSQIAALAITDGAAAAGDRLAKAFLSNGDDKQLAPLQSALKMNRGDFKQAIFAWKGILFYQWKLDASQADFMPIVQSLSRLKPIDADYETNRIVRAQSQRIVAALNRSMIKLAEELMAYEEVVRKLSDERDVSALSTFLNHAPETFNRVGDNASIINHCIDYWNFGFRNIDTRNLTSERALDIVNGLAAPLPAMEADEAEPDALTA